MADRENDGEEAAAVKGGAAATATSEIHAFAFFFEPVFFALAPASFAFDAVSFAFEVDAALFAAPVLDGDVRPFVPLAALVLAAAFLTAGFWPGLGVR